MIRLFVALELPDVVIDGLGALSAGVPGARWIEPENMHLTLRFLGEVDEARYEDVVEALDGVRAPVFELTLESFGTFSQGQIPHRLWVGVRRSEPLLQLQGKIERALVRAGFEPERRRFTPHVSLARLRDAPLDRLGDFMRRHEPFRMPTFVVEHVALFSSHLSKGNADYQVEERFALDGAGYAAYAALGAEDD